MMMVLLRTYLHRFFFTPPIPLRIIALLCMILIYGATGFLYFELPQNPDLSWSDGLWYSIVTMTTVGYGDFFPKSSPGRLFVGVPLMLLGIGLLGYVLSVVAAAFITARNKEIKGMSNIHMINHLVIINYTGLAKIERLIEEIFNDPSVPRNTGVVLIDEDLEELPQELLERHVHFIRGNPTRDETLSRANIDKARHAVVLVKRPGDPASETLNISIALAVEARSRKINTVVECFDPGTVELLRKAGSDRIVCTSSFDIYYVSQELLNPGVQSILSELLSNAGEQQLFVAPVVMTGSPRFSELSSACASCGHIAIGISRNGRTSLNLGPDFRLESGDMAITIGAVRRSSFSL